MDDAGDRHAEAAEGARYSPDLFLEPRIGTVHRLGPSWYLPASGGLPLIAAASADRGEAAWRIAQIRRAVCDLSPVLLGRLSAVCEIRRDSQRRPGAPRPEPAASDGGVTADANAPLGIVRLHDCLGPGREDLPFVGALLAHEAAHVWCGSYNERLGAEGARAWRRAMLADMRLGRRRPDPGPRTRPIGADARIHLHWGPPGLDLTATARARHLRAGGPFICDYVAARHAASLARLARMHRRRPRGPGWAAHWARVVAENEDLACSAGYWHLDRLTGTLFGEGLRFARLYPYRAALLGRWLGGG